MKHRYDPHGVWRTADINTTDYAAWAVIGAILLILAASSLSAANVTINSSVTTGQAFNTVDGCIVDNATGNSFCFNPPADNVVLSCPAFGVPALLNHSNRGVTVSMPTGICTPPVSNVTCAALPFNVSKVTNLDVRLNESQTHQVSELNATFSCSASPKVNIIKFYKQNEIVNYSENGNLVLLIPDPASVQAAAVATPAVNVFCQMDGFCTGQENPQTCPNDCQVGPYQQNLYGNNPSLGQQVVNGTQVVQGQAVPPQQDGFSLDVFNNPIWFLVGLGIVLGFIYWLRNNYGQKQVTSV